MIAHIQTKFLDEPLIMYNVSELYYESLQEFLHPGFFPKKTLTCRDRILVYGTVIHTVDGSPSRSTVFFKEGAFFVIPYIDLTVPKNHHRFL